jgi:hypothetical protein
MLASMAIKADIIADVSILGRFIDTSGFNDNQYFSIVLIIDGIDTSPSVIVSMSMSQPMTSMAP